MAIIGTGTLAGMQIILLAVPGEVVEEVATCFVDVVELFGFGKPPSCDEWRRRLGVKQKQ